MAKRSNSTNKSKLEQVNSLLEKSASKSESVTVRLRYPVKYKYTSLDGSMIVFDRAGSEQVVSRDDANILLGKVRKGCDCGSGSRINHIFEEVQA